MVAFRKFHYGGIDAQAVCLAASQTLKVNMIVVMYGRVAGFFAQRVLEAPFVVQNLVHDAAVQEGFQRPVNGYPVKLPVNFLFDIAMGKGIAFLHK